VKAALTVEELVGGYGDSTVLHGVSLNVQGGTIGVVLGRNGVGKTTLVRCMAATLPARSGKVLLGEQEISGRPAHEVAARGLGVLPQGKRVFRSLSVDENLAMGEMTRQRRAKLGADVSRAWSRQRILELFPVFGERMGTKAGNLSGGEQQMLAMARLMIGGPEVLVLDEPSEALSPARVKELSGLLAGLREEGMTILLIEQNLSFGLELADEVFVMERGAIAHRCDADEVVRDMERIEALLTL
jgi:branched-chain amino acid transport system ATP-binding protein